MTNVKLYYRPKIKMENEDFIWKEVRLKRIYTSYKLGVILERIRYKWPFLEIESHYT